MLAFAVAFALGAQAVSEPDAAWRADAAAFLAELRARHPNPTHSQSWQALEAKAGSVDGPGAMAELVASVGDGHTVMPLLDLPFDGVPKAPARALLPLRFELFDDGLYVVGAAREHRDLIGKKIEALGTLPLGEALTRVRRLLPQRTPRFQDEYAPEWLMADVVLRHIGAWGGDGPMRIRAGGVDKDVALAVPERPFDWLKTRTGGPWTNWQAIADPAPLDASGVTIPAPRILYWKLVELRPPPSGGWTDMLGDIASQFDAMEGRRLILDLRDTIGGDGTLVPALIAMLDRPALRKPGAVVALIGRRCHSACVMLVSALEKRGGVTFAGQATGDAPNHYGETNLFLLPTSGFPVIIASEYYVTGPPGDARPFKTPDFPIPFVHGDFADGTDPVMRWALSEELPQ